MSFIGTIFRERVCDACSGETSLLGNRKPEDGNLVKPVPECFPSGFLTGRAL